MAGGLWAHCLRECFRGAGVKEWRACHWALQPRGPHSERTKGPGTLGACPGSQRPLLCSAQGLTAEHTLPGIFSAALDPRHRLRGSPYQLGHSWPLLLWGTGRASLSTQDLWWPGLHAVFEELRLLCLLGGGGGRRGRVASRGRSGGLALGALRGCLPWALHGPMPWASAQGQSWGAGAPSFRAEHGSMPERRCLSVTQANPGA